MDRIVTSTEANQRFAEIVRDACAGDSFTVTSHGKPVARIIPPDAPKPRPTAEELKEFWAEMDKFPLTVVGPWTRDDLYDRNWGA